MKTLFSFASALLLAPAIDAQTVTYQYYVDVSDFTSSGESSPPVSEISGTFKITFDKSAWVTNDTAHISLSGFTFGEGTPTFNYQPWDDSLLIRSTGDYTLLPSAGSDGWALWIYDATQSWAGISLFEYTDAHTVDTYQPVSEAGLNATQLSVPESATWILMLGGFGLVGSALRGRRKVAVTFA